MHLTTLAGLCVLSSSGLLVVANNCYGPYNWCGWDLMKAGNYEGYIKQQLRSAAMPTDDFTVKNSLFFCHPDNSGEADFIGTCPNGCVYGGGKNTNDRCA
ncbi:unnamed protein product [Periconia digitata]|uniref:Uncharacterized protein n=1 Tax=Periconia digitata TaxID=1303443 RepID=A0A9W4UMA4_9PLEO|nr:unnamed protein product [Periconia digitata]